MSTYSGSSRSSKRHSASNLHSLAVMPPPAPVSTSSARWQENSRPRNGSTPREGAALWRHEKSHPELHTHSTGTIGKTLQHHLPTRSQARPSTQKESIMTRNRQVRTPTAFETEDAVTVTVGLVGAKFKCLVEKEWPCESLVASAIAEYHLAFPTCEVPDCSIIHHVGRKGTLEPRDPVGKWCRDGDEIELGMRDRPISHPSDEAPPPADEGLNFHTYDFTIVFHRLPLGFTLRQEMDATVVANIYPKSAATHYERLVPGTIVVQMGDKPLEDLGLRQVHEVIRHCKLPLAIKFRGWKKPVARGESFIAIADTQNVASPRLTPAPSSEPHTGLAQRRKSAPSAPPHSTGNASVRARASTAAPAATGIVGAAAPPLFCSPGEATASNLTIPSPYSQTRQKTTSERKKSNSSPYADHRASAAERRASKGGRNSPVGEQSVPRAEQLDTRSNQGDSPDASPTSVADLKLKQTEFHPTDAAALNLNGVVEQFAATSINEPSNEDELRQCEVDSNQNEDESEEMIMEHIKILQAELIKKHEEAKQLAKQLETYRARLNSVQQKREKNGRRPSATTTAKPTVHRASVPNLTLTPEVLEAIEVKQGLPAKGHYAGSNASSVSGYSSYSNRSAAVAKRQARQLSRFVGKTGETSTRGDASISSCNSAYRREHSGGVNIGDGLPSPRRQAVQNVNHRYSQMPSGYEAPSSFSTKGGLISRAKVTRDSYIKIPDTPGVGAYDVKLPRERVRGGEIGDSDRSLPWP